MRTSWIPAILLGGAALVYAADDKPADKPAPPTQQTPSQKLEALKKEFKQQEDALLKQYRAAKVEDRNKIVQQFRVAIQTAGRQMFALAELNPTDPVAIQALSWILSQPGGQTDEVKKALAWLARDFAASPDIGPICQSLDIAESAEAGALLQAVRDKNPSRDIRGLATYALASGLFARSEERTATKADADKLRQESEHLFEEMIAKYGDVKDHGKTLAKKGQGSLFELRNLAIGKTAPDIQGTDSDGKTFRLSDYRGKVVVLDFWARW
jgi:AhpC/TSA family